MIEYAVLADLRAIRDVLILTSGEDVDGLVEGLGVKHGKLLAELKTDDWLEGNEVVPELADEFRVSNKTIQRRKDDLLDQELLEQRGEAAGTKYRKNGFGLVAQRASEV